MHIRDVIHIVFAIVGIPANFVLLFVIIKTRHSSNLKAAIFSYTMILFNIAIFDIFEIVLEVFGEPRMIVIKNYIIFIFHGYCTLYGSEVCYVLHTIGVHLGFFSFSLTAYSFWFRYTVLSKPPPSWLNAQLVIFALFIPNALLAIFCFFTPDASEQTTSFLEQLYPDMSLNTTIHRSNYLFDTHSIPTVIWSPIVPVVTYAAVIILRGKILRKLDSLAENMSEQTNLMHRSLIRALTCHAVLPLTICIGISSFYFQLAGVRGEIIDSMLFMFACIPSVFNPILTLFFVKPYHRAQMNQSRVWYWLPVGFVLIPSTILHLTVVLTVWRGRHKFPYNSLFYKLFLVQSLIDIPLIFLHLGCRIITKDKLADSAFIMSTNGTVFPIFYYYGTTFIFLYLQVWGVSVQSFARCLAVCAPTSRVKHFLDAISGLQWFLIQLVVAFAIILRQLVQDPVGFGLNSDGTTFLDIPPHVFQEWNQTQPVIVTAVGAMFSAGCYVLILRKLLTNRATSTSREFHREKMLAVVGFSLFLALVSMTAHHILAAISAFHNVLLGPVFKDLYIVPVALLTFVNPWMLTLTNKGLRMRMLGTGIDGGSAVHTIKCGIVSKDTISQRRL